MAGERPFEDKAKPKAGFLNLGSIALLSCGGLSRALQDAYE